MTVRAHRHSRKDERFSASANLLGTIAGDGKLGDVEHRFGNAVNYDVTANYRVTPGSFAPARPQLFLAFGLNAKPRGKRRTTFAQLIPATIRSIFHRALNSCLHLTGLRS
ncbi:MAG TPA: hypothetical protein VK654_03990 [Nitrospirota bacterium]|nr:hypothetical protein [Nitrospirota bacterium]